MFLRISQVMKMTVSWGMCNCVFNWRNTVILEERTASLFRAYINLNKEERRHSIGDNFGVKAVSEPIEHSRTNMKKLCRGKI
jgi:hypothetical protein